MASEPVKDTAIRTYLKEKTNLRVEQGPVDLLTRHLTMKAEKIVARAAALVAMEERTTLQQRDMERAIEEVDREGQGDGQGQSPEDVYKVVQGYSVEQLGELGRRIEESLK